MARCESRDPRHDRREHRNRRRPRRLDASGTGLLLSRFTGEGGAPLFERVSSLTTGRVLAWAALTAGGTDVLFTTPVPGNSDALQYHVVLTAGGTPTPLPLAPESNSADLTR